jgi:large subunit ribosomal protein L18
MKKIGRTVRRRRKESKTDYKARFGFLKSGEPRIIFRKTNRYIIGQIVNSEIAQDRIIVGVNSRDLLKAGWPEELKGSLKNLGACYLTGYMLGRKSRDVKKAIFDIGLQRNIAKSRIYAFLKGVLDAEIEVAHNEKVLPSEEIIGKDDKMQKIIEKVKGELK